MRANTVLINDEDNVGIAITDLQQGDTAIIKTESGMLHIPVSQPVPFGHKIAIKNINLHEHVIKYGESIGASTENIEKGHYVHTHNLESLRGRGDLGQ